MSISSKKSNNAIYNEEKSSGVAFFATIWESRF